SRPPWAAAPRTARSEEPHHPTLWNRPAEEVSVCPALRPPPPAPTLPTTPRFHRLLVAGPAMGKTALLRAIARQVATGLDWVVVPHRCRPKERALGTVTSEVLAGLQRQWPAEGAAMAAEVLGRRLAGDWLGYPDEFRAGQSLAPTPPSL